MLRVERLDPAAQDLREAREVLDRARLDARLRAARAPCRRWRRSRRRARPARARSPRGRACRTPTAARAARGPRPAAVASRAVAARTRAISRPHARAAGCTGSECTRPAGDQPHRTRQQPCSIVRSAARPRRDVAMVRQLERLLQDDRAGVDALVDEVDGDAEDLDAVARAPARSARSPGNAGSSAGGR